MGKTAKIAPGSPEAYFSRELSWLAFARRVLSLAADERTPLLERLRFAGIVGMLHDEFFMKRVSGLMRLVSKGSRRMSQDGRTPAKELAACRAEVLEQDGLLRSLLAERLRPALAEIRRPIRDHADLSERDRRKLQAYFRQSVQPILTPLAVDAEHPFPFISNLGLNLAVMLPDDDGERFVRIKVPNNRPRWVPLPGGEGCVPLEQVIAANLDSMFPDVEPLGVYHFRVTRGAEAPDEHSAELTLEESFQAPGSIVSLVSSELKARRFAGIVRLEIDESMPRRLVKWLARQLHVKKAEIHPAPGPLGISDLKDFDVDVRGGLRFPPHRPADHPRLAQLDPADSGAIFDEIRRGDLLLHHPYDSFDTSVLRFLESASIDPQVLAIKLTIYRTSRDSPTVRALAEAARRGKQVAVQVEITARFDEAPNIAWGRYLEAEGVHVSYGVERLKTHVKLALVIREEQGTIRRYVHTGTGNYHSGTARIYEDVGVLTCHAEICDDVNSLFNSLTGATPFRKYAQLVVAPTAMRKRFIKLIRGEARNARDGKPCGIHAKMNQLQDPAIIRELYRASQAGVPILLNVRGLCCLRPGVPGLSESIRVFGVVGRFLEHSRIYRFVNGGNSRHYLGSADWMKRNLDSRVETLVPILDPAVKRELDLILQVYVDDNASVWDCGPDGRYTRRSPGTDETPQAAQTRLIEMTAAEGAGDRPGSASLRQA